MTVAETCPFAAESVIAILDGQWSVHEEHVQEALNLLLKHFWRCAFLHSTKVFPEARGEPNRSHLAL
jgi:hypothetical protein